MANDNKITVPDIGGAADVEVIEILVQKGDEISEDQSLITLESDKASMEIPAPKAGVVHSIALHVGDKVSQGDLILTLANEGAGSLASGDNKSAAPAEVKKEDEPKSAPKEEKPSYATESKTVEVKVPDIGGASGVDVIEIFVKAGDEIKKDDSIITLESDKASMEIPAPQGGIVNTVKIHVGDRVSEGDLILLLDVQEQTDVAVEEKKQEIEQPNLQALVEADKSTRKAKEPLPAATDDSIFAGPAVRRLARELGVNLTEVRGSGRKSRITKEDIQQFVKGRLQEKSSASGLAFPPAAQIDFSQFGEVEVKPLNKIKRLTGENVHRSWVTIPHVTQFDEADITDLEAFRKQEAEKAKQEGYKLTLLAFVCKAVTKALVAFPQFNSSLDPNGGELVYKKYFNIGVAVDTPNGLVVPVIKGVDKLSVSEIAKEMARLSSKAREKGLMPAEMSGGCFTISSLGGIGGTAFTPIVNSPEVAILGLSRSNMKPVYENGSFVPRLMLPLSLSYDHRVVDGAEAARFTRYVSECLSDIRKILL